jgi:hypothetical protein
LHDGLIVAGLFRRKVQDQETVHTRPGRIGDKLFQARLVNEVVINVEDNGEIAVAPDGSNRLQDFGRRCPGIQPALGGQLIDRSVGQWVAERDA